MSSNQKWFHWQDETLFLQLLVQPKSCRDEFVGPHGDSSYKIKITAPPNEGKANQHLCRFLAKAFGVCGTDVKLIRGKSSRIKYICIKKPQKSPIPAVNPLQQE